LACCSFLARPPARKEINEPLRDTVLFPSLLGEGGSIDALVAGPPALDMDENEPRLPVPPPPPNSLETTDELVLLPGPGLFSIEPGLEENEPPFESELGEGSTGSVGVDEPEVPLGTITGGGFFTDVRAVGESVVCGGGTSVLTGLIPGRDATGFVSASSSQPSSSSSGGGSARAAEKASCLKYVLGVGRSGGGPTSAYFGRGVDSGGAKARNKSRPEGWKAGGGGASAETRGTPTARADGGAMGVLGERVLCVAEKSSACRLLMGTFLSPYVGRLAALLRQRA